MADVGAAEAQIERMKRGRVVKAVGLFPSNPCVGLEAASATSDRHVLRVERPVSAQAIDSATNETRKLTGIAGDAARLTLAALGIQHRAFGSSVGGQPGRVNVEIGVGVLKNGTVVNAEEPLKACEGAYLKVHAIFLR